MLRKIVLVAVGVALLFALELGYSVAIHNDNRVGSFSREKPFSLQGPFTATFSMLTQSKR